MQMLLAVVELVTSMLWLPISGVLALLLIALLSYRLRGQPVAIEDSEDSNAEDSSNAENSISVHQTDINPLEHEAADPPVLVPHDPQVSSEAYPESPVPVASAATALLATTASEAAASETAASEVTANSEVSGQSTISPTLDTPDHDPVDYYELGNLCFARQDYQTALKHYTQAIEARPG
ncbi:MAG: hypothetical protein F6K19_13580, partial [Cyanothece sp. SIO1E1]|nr:hypothetical protein [Cyanothece sp. SIO1E1]